MWKGGKLLCYKRAASLSFYNSTQQKTYDNTTIMKTCALDKTFEVTTLPELDCPISDFSNTSFGTTQTTLSLDLVNSLNFVSQSHYPIADFKLT